MATAKKRVVTREVVTTVEEVNGVTLELSKEEAESLAALFAKIAGSPTRSRRGYTNAIQDALREAGFYWETSKAYDSLGGEGVFFESEPGINL